jgi:hypothetical protein
MLREGHRPINETPARQPSHDPQEQSGAARSQIVVIPLQMDGTWTYVAEPEPDEGIETLPRRVVHAGRARVHRATAQAWWERTSLGLDRTRWDKRPRRRPDAGESAEPAGRPSTWILAAAPNAPFATHRSSHQPPPRHEITLSAAGPAAPATVRATVNVTARWDPRGPNASPRI